MTDPQLPIQTDGVWPLSPGLIAHVVLNAEDRAKGEAPSRPCTVRRFGT